MINEGQSHKRERLMQTPYTGTEAVSKLLRSFGQISEAVSRFGNTLNDIHISATNIEHEFRNLASMMAMSRYTLSQMRPGSGGSSGGGYQGGSYVEELQTYEFMQRAKAAIRKRLRAEDKDLAAPDYAEQLTEYGNFLKAKQAVRELFAPKDNRQEFSYKKAFNEYVEFLDAKEAEQNARKAKKENSKQDNDFYGDNLKKYLDFLGRKEQYMTEFENRQRSRKQFDIYPDLLKKHKDYLAKKLQNEMEYMDQLLQLRNANAILEKAFNKQIYSFTAEAARAGQQSGAKGTDSSKYVSEDLEKFANSPEVGEGKAAYITMDLETGAPGGVNIGDDRYKEEADILQFAVEFRDKFGKVLDRVNAFFTPEGGIQLPKEAGMEGNEDKFASFREDFKKATKTTAKEANKEFLEKFAKYGDKNTVTLVKTSFDAEFASKNKRQKTQDLSETFKTLFGKSNKTLDIEKAFEALMKAQENRSPTKTSELKQKFLAQIPEGESRDKSRYKFKIEYMASALQGELSRLAQELEETSDGALSFHNALEDVRVESLLFLYAQRELLKFAKVKKPVDKEATEAAKKNTKETKENTAATQKNSKGSPPPGRTTTASVNTGGVQQVEIVAPLPLPVKIVEGGGGGGSSPTFQMPDIGAMLEQGIALREKLRKQHAEDAEHKKAQKEKEAQKAAAENPTPPPESSASTTSTPTPPSPPPTPASAPASSPGSANATASSSAPVTEASMSRVVKDLGNGLKIVMQKNSKGQDVAFTYKWGRFFLQIENEAKKTLLLYRSAYGTGGKKQGAWHASGGILENKNSSEGWIVKGNPKSDPYMGRPEIESLITRANEELDKVADLKLKPFLKELSEAAGYKTSVMKLEGDDYFDAPTTYKTLSTGDITDDQRSAAYLKWKELKIDPTFGPRADTSTSEPERPKRDISKAGDMAKMATEVIKDGISNVQKTAQAATNISRDPLRMQVGPHGNLMEDNEDPKSFRVFHKTKAGTLSKKARIFDKREEAEDFFRKNEGVEIEAAYSGGRKKRYIPGKSLAETEAGRLNPTNFETPIKGDFQTEPKRDISVEQQTAKEASAAAAEQQKKTSTALVALSQATRELVEIVQKNTSVIPVGSVSPRGALVPATPPGSPPASPPPPKGPEIQDAEWSTKNPEKKEKEKGYDGPEDLSFMEALSFSFDRLTGAAYQRGYDPNKTFDDRKASFDKYVDDLRDALDKLVFDIMHAGDRIKIEPEAPAPSAASNTGYQGGATVTGGWNGWDMDPGTPSSGGPSSPAAPGNTNTPQLPGPSSPGSLSGPGGSSPPPGSPPPGSPPASPAPGASAPQPEAPKGPMPFNPNMRAEEILGFESGYVPTEDELKKAFREKSKEHHPDRGGSTYNMSRINAAQQYLKTGKYEGWDKEREVAKGSYADALRQAGYETEAAAFEESLKKGTEYKATGGSVNNDKAPDKGTDTVDAKLTPGEFIVRKEKASKYAKFLQALNNGKLDETLNKKGGIVHYLSGGGFATATATASGSGGFGGPPRYGPPAPPVSPPSPPAPPPPPPPSGGGPLVPANRFPPPANFPTPLPVKIDTATTVPVKFVQTGWWSGKTWQKKDREVDPKKAPPINDPRVHGHRGDIFAPLKTWMHNFIETTRVGYIAKSFMALGQALQGTMNTMAGFVKAAAPDVFATLTGSLQLLMGAIGIQFIPIIMRVSAVIQDWANDILMGKGVLGAFFQKVGEMLSSIDAETLEGFVGIGLVVAGIVAMAPAIGIVTSVLGIFASAISVIVSAFSIAINVIMGFGKMLVWAVRGLSAFGMSLIRASGGTGLGGFVAGIARLIPVAATLLGTFKAINDWWNKEKLKEAKKNAQSLQEMYLEQDVIEGDPEQKFAQERAEAAKKEGKDKAGVVEQLKKEETFLYEEAQRKYAQAEKESKGTGFWDKNKQVRPISETEAYKEYQALKRKENAIKQQREIEEGKRKGFYQSNKEAAEERKKDLIKDYTIDPKTGKNRWGQTEKDDPLNDPRLKRDLKEYDDAVIKRDMARQEGKPLIQPVDPRAADLGGGPVKNLVGGIMEAMPAIPEIPGLKGLAEGNLGKAFADIKKKLDNAFDNMAGNQKGKFVGPPKELMNKNPEDQKKNLAMSFQSMKAQSSFSSVEEAYKKIQVAALGDDPMTAELKKMNEISLLKILQELEKGNNNNNNNAKMIANAGNVK